MGLVDRTSNPYQVTLATPPGTYSAPNWAALDYTQTAYDAFGRATLITAPDGSTAQTIYDGRFTAVIDPNGHQHASLVDDFGRTLEVYEYTGQSDPYTLYATTAYTYDARGLLLTATDAQSNVTTISYDALGRKTGMDDPDMGEWEYDYDLWGQLVEQTDARGAQVRFEYDKLGRVTLRQSRMTALDSWVTAASYTYDQTTGGSYGIGRSTQVDSVYVGGSPTVTDTVTYDLLGRPIATTRTIDGVDYAVGYTYDSLGRILTTTYPDPDGAGPLTAETVTTAYNARGLFESLIGTDTYVSSTDYTASGAIDDQTLGNGVITDYTYEDQSERLERILTGKPAFLPLVDLSYTYDDAGNVTQVDDDVHDEVRSYVYDDLDRLVFADVYSGVQMIEERYYTYDTIGNLLSFRHRYPASGWGTGSVGSGEQMEGTTNDSRGSFNSMSGHNLSSENYQSAGILPFIAGLMYSTAGPNNTRGAIGSAGQSISTNYVNYGAFNSATGAGSATSYDGRGINPYVYGEGGGYGDQGGGYTGPTGETIINYTYGENDAGPHAVTSRSNGDSFAYDDNGNMTSRTMDGVTWTQVFDAENRLVEVDDGTTETTYVYDGAGNRIKRIVDDSTTVTTTLYVAGMEIELVDSVESQRKIYYSAGGAFRIIGGNDEGLYFKHGDHLGSTSVLSDSTGAKVADSDVLYAPFGEVRTGELSELTDFGFTGQILDRSSGDLMYYGSRYYLPSLKRFISADTVTPSVLNGQALNRYSYVKNDPINSIDPSGHCSPEDLGCWIQRYIDAVRVGPHNGGIDPSTQGDNGEWDGGSGSEHEAEVIMEGIEETLNNYGVSVDAEGTVFEQAEEYVRVAEAVWAMAVSAYDEAVSQGFEPDSYSEAFKKVFGEEHTITVTPDKPSSSSQCNDLTLQACNIGNFLGDNDGAEIYISKGAILGGREAGGFEPTHILVHEFAHTFTNPIRGDVFNNNRDIFDFVKFAGDVYAQKHILENPDFPVLVASRHYDENGNMIPSEVTADAIAGWVFGYHDDEKLNSFMTTLIQYQYTN